MTTLDRPSSLARRRRGLGLRPRRRRRRPARQRGIAILAVVTAIAIALMIVNEFGTRTTIDMLQARNNLDQTRAHFLARSALNLSELLLRMQKSIDDNAAKLQAIGIPPGFSIGEVAGPIIGAFGGDEQEVKDSIGIVSMDDVKGLGADIGRFDVTMVPVDGKINVNCAATDSQKKRLSVMLKSLFFPYATNAMFDDEDAEGWRRDFQTQVEAIIDYIDVDTSHVDVKDRPIPPGTPAPTTLPQGGGEDYGYENLRDRYKPKNNRIDSVGELRLVRGIDDRMWTLFSGAFRVHGGCPISVRALDDITVISAVISAGAAADDPNVRADPNLPLKLASLVVQARAVDITFPTVKEFTDFVADPVTILAAMAQEAQQNPTPGMPDLAGLIKDPSLKGIKLVDAQVRGILTDQPPRAYEVEAYAEVDRMPPLLPLRRTIRGMWDMRAHLDQPRFPKPAPSEGAWQWLREQ